MARKKEICSLIAGKRLKTARYDVFGLTQTELVEGGSGLPENKRGIAEKWISVFGKQQSVRTVSRWENQGIPESRIGDAAFCFHADAELFTDPDIPDEQFKEIIRQANCPANDPPVCPETNILQLSEELGITRTALNNFFRILDIQKVPLENLDAALRKFAGEYREMLAKFETFRSDDPEIMRLKRKAKAELDAGSFDRADFFLESAVKRDTEIAEQFRENLHRRLLSAAETNAERGNLEYARLNYRKSACHYKAAADTVPEGEQWEVILAGYLIRQGSAYRLAGDYREARPPLEKSLEILKKYREKFPYDPAAALLEIGWLYKCIGEYEKCESLFERALEICETEREEGRTASVLKDLGLICEIRGKYRKAEQYLKRALAIREKRFGENDNDVIHICEFLGRLYKYQGRFGESEQLLVQSLEKMRKVLGPSHPSTLVCMNVVGKLYCDLGRYEEAEPLLRESLDKVRSIFGRGHPGMVISLGKLGELCTYQGRYREAETLLYESLEINRRLMGKEHLSTAITLERLGTLELFRGRYAEAEAFFRESFSLFTGILGNQHYRSLSCLAKLCETCVHLGSLTKAEEMIRRFLLPVKSEFSDEHPFMAAALMNQGLVCKARGQYEESIGYFRTSLAIMEKHFAPGHRRLQSCRKNLVTLMRPGNAV